VVAGQTQEHPATIVGIGAATVPRMVPPAFRTSAFCEKFGISPSRNWKVGAS
jgi:hypothetical protein